MCGIAGYYSSQQVFDFQELPKMTDCMQYRGPDADGFYNDCFVGLAHRRLKIIDLSDAANQPMISKSGRYVIVYNGEIYNYNDLRREFQLETRTHSDTEIVLELCEKIGIPETIALCNGMFAIALYDTHTHKLSLIRDRMGVKPVFYFWDGEHFAFGSEIKTLLQLSHIRAQKSCNHKVISQFLHLGYTGITETIYTNIYKLPAGSCLQISGTDMQITRYWDIREKLSSNLITEPIQAREMLRDLLETSVRYRLKSDVDFGCFLSGGIDSSIVAAIAQRNLSTKLKTFTIGFEHAAHDESKHAKKIADFLGTEHYEMMVTESDARNLIDSILPAYDEPYADSSAIPTMLVSKLAGQHVSMTLSGDGGDELFMGYGAYNWAERLSKPFWKYAHTLAGRVLHAGTARQKRAGNVFLYPNSANIPSHIFSQEQNYFSRKEIANLLASHIPSEFEIEENYKLANRLITPAENQALFDMRYYLCEDLLAKVDRATMQYSIESRVPLLDYTVVEFALHLSPDLKRKGAESKYLLKQVLYEYVPAHFFDRPKWGFSIPLHIWLRTDLRYLIDEYLNPDCIQKHGIFNQADTQNLVSQYLSGKKDYLYNRVWLLILIQRFMEEQF